MSALVVVFVLLHSVGGPARKAPHPQLPTRPASSQAPAPSGGVTVPPILGLPVDRARDMLAKGGLDLAGVKPAVGTPGVVVGSDPTPGDRVAPGTKIFILVGVEGDRLRSERPSTGASP